MAIVLLLSLTSGTVYSAQAEPFVVAQSKHELAAGPFSNFVAEAAQRFGLPTLWIDAVMMGESAGDERAVSPQGAMGLMQIMPDTWKDLRSRHGLGPDPFDPHDNILAGAAYMREMLDRYGSPGFLAAYNAGPRRYEEYLTTGRELPLETQVYVATLAPMIGAPLVGGRVAIARREAPWQESALFAARSPHGLLAGWSPLGPSDRASDKQSSAGQPALQPRPDGLFVSRASARALQ
ncbi:MAG: lytic transglycosylase domain-containing protein [Rhizobiales bacterium]|nr:lytic transglycosylase domain-containing protein [Hyphomicrobiales bacterium]